MIVRRKSDVDDVVRIAMEIAAVIIQVRGNLAGPIRWICGKPFGTEQTLFFCADQANHDRPPRCFRQRLESSGHCNDLANTGRIVHRTVVNRVTVRIRRTDTQVIVV